MQTWSGQNASSIVSPSRKLIITILSVFSLAGLVIGFTIGGLTHPKSNPTGNTGPVQKPTIAAHTTATATPTATLPPTVLLGFPEFSSTPTTTESATDGTQYTVSMQAVDKQKKSVHSSDVTCKLWLVANIPDHQNLDIAQTTLKAVDNLKAAITGTVNKIPSPELPYLNFDATTDQTVHCNANGQATWKYTIATAALPGNYDLVILADWKGAHWNWSWVNITIK
jgi:hypothetical protein